MRKRAQRSLTAVTHLQLIGQPNPGGRTVGIEQFHCSRCAAGGLWRFGVLLAAGRVVSSCFWGALGVSLRCWYQATVAAMAWLARPGSRRAVNVRADLALQARHRRLPRRSRRDR